MAIEKGLDPAADRDDLVVVPVLHVDERLTRFGREHLAAMLLVQLAPPAQANVGLVATYIAIGQNLTAELDSAVLLVGHQLHLHRQAKIIGNQLTLEELILLDARAVPDDLAILHLPQL